MSTKTISYGKNNVSFYRTLAKPLTVDAHIPESAFSMRGNDLLAFDIKVEVFGDNFYDAYTKGDNSKVVPTDTMKNFIMEKAFSFGGSTLEEFLHYLGKEMLETYSQMQGIAVSGKQLGYKPVTVYDGNDSYLESNKLFTHSQAESPAAEIEIKKNEKGENQIVSHQCGMTGFKLIKITGSSFFGFSKDKYTSLPEAVDRPLYIYFDVFWKYLDHSDGVKINSGKYIAFEQMRDLIYHTFDSFVSMSIQHLIYEFGKSILKRFPQLAEVSFSAQNHLWDTAVEKNGVDHRVYTDPRPPYGVINLTMNRESIESESWE